MKIPAATRPAGFTLVELLTVVAIIMILAALTIAALSYFNRKSAEDKCRVQVKLIERALEEYKLDNGAFPLNEKSDGTGASTVLVKSLYTDCVTNKSTIYMPQFDINSQGGQKWIDKAGKLTDGFGYEFRYRCFDTTKEGSAAMQKNPDFDLWSVGADGKTDTANPASKSNLDDLW